MTMTNSANQPIPPVVPRRAADGDAGGIDDVEAFTDEETPVDPDVDASQVDSADADRRAATEGTKDGTVEQ